MTVEELVEIELIKQLKARYFRFMDLGLWEEFTELFCEDCEQSWQPSPQEPAIPMQGRDAVVASIRDSVAGLRSVHHGHMPEIEITSSTTARGIWALYDHCTQGSECIFDGAGYYHDEYEKIRGEWRIRSTHLAAEPFHPVAD